MPAPLLVEIGNSSIKLAQPRDDGSFVVQRFNDPEAFLEALPQPSTPVLCAPVGVAFTGGLIARIAEDHPLRLISTDDFPNLLRDSYDTPATVGLDRLLNLRGMTSDGVVISCGTAITVDAVVDGQASFGAIMPGFQTSVAGLHNRLPQLPAVALDDAVGLPARTSNRSVANGLLLGTAYGAIGLATELSQLLVGSGGMPLDVVVTGGDALLLSRLWRGSLRHRVDEALLFRGMLAI